MNAENIDMDNTLYWSRVKELLKKNKKTQVELCKETEIILGTMKGWQVNNRLPGSEESVKIAKALNTSVEYLVTGQESNLYKEKYDTLVTAIKELPI